MENFSRPLRTLRSYYDNNGNGIVYQSINLRQPDQCLCTCITSEKVLQKLEQISHKEDTKERKIQPATWRMGPLVKHPGIGRKGKCYSNFQNFNFFLPTEWMKRFVRWFWLLSLCMKSYGVTILMKATEQYFPVILFIMLYKVVLTFVSVDEILWCDHLKESYWAVLSCSTVYYAVEGGSNFWVCGWNPMVWPFQWSLSRSAFTRYYLFFCILQQWPFWQTRTATVVIERFNL